jgi:hypothetical protein
VIAAANLLSSWEWSGIRAVLPADALPAHWAAAIFLVTSVVTLAATGYVPVPAAGFPAAAAAMADDAYPVSPRRGGTSSAFPSQGRSAAGAESCVHGGCGISDRGAGPAHPVSDVQGILRSSVGQTVRKNSAGHSDRLRPGTAGPDSFLARGHRGAAETASWFAFFPRVR